MEVRRTTEGFPTRCSAIKGVDEFLKGCNVAFGPNCLSKIQNKSSQSCKKAKLDGLRNR